MGDYKRGFGDGVAAGCEGELVEDAEPAGEGGSRGVRGGDFCDLLGGGLVRWGRVMKREWVWKLTSRVWRMTA